MIRVLTFLIITGLQYGFAQWLPGADRLTEVKMLVNQYEAAEEKFFNVTMPDNPTTADKIQHFKAWPGWRYIPKFVALAEAKPDDEAAFLCCQWIIDRTGNVGNQDKGMFDADQKAWAILTAHHTQRSDLPMLCLRAVQYYGPEQEHFLRGLLTRQDLSRENKGFATVALGESLAQKHNTIEIQRSSTLPKNEFRDFLQKQKSPDWGKDLIPANAAKFKAESILLFRDVLTHYAEIPVTITAPNFRNLKNLGEKASKSLYALEHLTIGSKPPHIVGKDLHGQPLDLQNYEGHVVLISFWFTGCGPCVGFIPQEQRLIKTYKGRPFVLLGVCTDESREMAQKTAKEHKLDWPCWFDGSNGPIAQDWNVLSWPTTYVLDRNGQIAAKNIRGDALDMKIAELMEEKK